MKIEQAKLELEGIQNEIDNYNKQIDTLTKEMEKVDESERHDYTTQIQNIQNSIAQKQFDMESKKLEISKRAETGQQFFRCEQGGGSGQGDQ